MLCRFVGSNYVEILILPDSDSGQSPLRCNYLSSRQATPGSSLPSRNSSDAPPPVLMWVISLAWTVALLAVGVSLFGKVEKTFVDTV